MCTVCCGPLAFCEALQQDGRKGVIGLTVLPMARPTSGWRGDPAGPCSTAAAGHTRACLGSRPQTGSTRPMGHRGVAVDEPQERGRTAVKSLVGEREGCTPISCSSKILHGGRSCKPAAERRPLTSAGRMHSRLIVPEKSSIPITCGRPANGLLSTKTLAPPDAEAARGAGGRAGCHMTRARREP